VFVLDTSGSMSGFPIEKAKETMKLALDNLYPYDTFNLITFAGDEHILFPEPVPATKENLEKAQKFLDTREGWWRDGNDEGHQGFNGSFRQAGPRAHCLLHDRRLRRQRHGNHSEKCRSTRMRASSRSALAAALIVSC
jgi:Ca-activated chloride channel family protein